MNSTGRKSEKSGYLVILLLVVGLTAFSHSMKELTEIHQLTLDASRLVAQWSGNVTPAEIPQIPSCQSQQSVQAAVELPRITEPGVVAPARTQQSKTLKIERRVIPSEAQIAKLKKLPHIDIDADSFEVRVPTGQTTDSDELPTFTFKTKTRKPGASKINPRDREILLKTLNRSINLRIAS
jgi:hypothetical protein